MIKIFIHFDSKFITTYDQYKDFPFDKHFFNFHFEMKEFLIGKQLYRFDFYKSLMNDVICSKKADNIPEFFVDLNHYHIRTLSETIRVVD
jgi:hypothetical protein